MFWGKLNENLEQAGKNAFMARMLSLMVCLTLVIFSLVFSMGCQSSDTSEEGAERPRSLKVKQKNDGVSISVGIEKESDLPRFHQKKLIKINDNKFFSFTPISISLQKTSILIETSKMFINHADIKFSAKIKEKENNVNNFLDFELVRANSSEYIKVYFSGAVGGELNNVGRTLLVSGCVEEQCREIEFDLRRPAVLEVTFNTVDLSEMSFPDKHITLVGKISVTNPHKDQISMSYFMKRYQIELLKYVWRTSYAPVGLCSSQVNFTKSDARKIVAAIKILKLDRKNDEIIESLTSDTTHHRILINAGQKFELGVFVDSDHVVKMRTGEGLFKAKIIKNRVVKCGYKKCISSELRTQKLHHNRVVVGENKMAHILRFKTSKFQSTYSDEEDVAAVENSLFSTTEHSLNSLTFTNHQEEVDPNPAEYEKLGASIGGLDDSCNKSSKDGRFKYQRD